MSAALYRTIRPCPICGGHTAVALHEQRFAQPEGAPLPSAYTVASCEACGACFADTAAPQAAYDLHYQQYSKYDDPSLGSGGGATTLDRERLQETAMLIASLPLPKGRASRVLDIGCAGGGLLSALAEQGFSQLGGMDPSPACVLRVRNQGFDCQPGTLLASSGKPAAPAHDLVILSHVVEHILDVGAAMQAARQMLAPEGVCYIEVPDAGRYAADAFVPFYFFDSEHINHFDRASLANLARTNGFSVLSEGIKDLRVDGGGLYPAVWSLFQTGADRLPPLSDLQLRSSLATYIEASTWTSESGPLSEIASSGRPVLLWGAGQHAQRLLQNSPLARCNLLGVVDRDPGKQGLSLQGHSIRQPELALKELPPDAVVVVASVLHGAQIAAALAQSGLPNRVVVAR